MHADDRITGPDPLRRSTASAVRLFLLLWIVLTAALSFVPADLQAQPVEDLLVDDPDVPWEIQAGSVEYDAGGDVYIAQDGVTIIKGPLRLSADRIRFDRKQMTADAEGHVILTSGKDVLRGSRIEINLNDETGVIQDGDIFLQESHFYIRGERIEKIGKDAYRAYRASVTTCDGDNPDWKITGKEVRVRVEGYGTVQHAALWARSVPVFYTPFFIFPAKRERQTGLLVPQLGRSERRGLSYSQPLFWAIDDNSDATFYYHYMADRGHKLGGEYRYLLSPVSKGAVMFDYLEDRKIDDGTGNSSELWGYEGDAYDRPNADRYWFRMKADQALPAGLIGRVDLDVVSDQDYLYEFKGGYSGYDDTAAFFRHTFGRDLDDYNDPVRANRVKINRTWPRYSANAEVLWYDNVVRRRWEETDPTLHRLPFVTFNTAKQPIADTPFFWTLDADYTYYYRQDGTKGHRADLHPRLALPWRFRYLFVEPSVGVRETYWHTDPDPDTDPETAAGGQSRETFDARVAFYTQMYNVYTLSPRRGGLLRRLDLWPYQVKHTIRPQIVYAYAPDQDQADFPFFDALDRLEPRNRITLSLTQTLVSKTRNLAPVRGTETDDYLYHRFCRFELQQSYDFDRYDPSDTVRDSILFPDPANPEEGEHLSPLYARLELVPASFFSLQGDAEWSHQESDFISRNVAAVLRDGRGDRLAVEHRYTREFNESLNTNLTVRLTRRLTASADYERNLRDGENIRTGLGLLYSAQCWSLNFQYVKDLNDEYYGFMINLSGLGGIGTN